MDYCKSIGKREGTLSGKERFKRYQLSKIVNLDDNISALTKDKIQNHINSMINSGFKGNYCKIFVIKIRAFLTFCFERKYLERFEVKIPNIISEKKEVYTEAEINCFLVNASEEGKEVILTNLATTEVEKVNIWSIVKNNLVVNSTKINIRDIHESRTGNELHNNIYLLEVI